MNSKYIQKIIASFLERAYSAAYLAGPMRLHRQRLKLIAIASRRYLL
jgi:hypothetical protein